MTDWADHQQSSMYVHCCLSQLYWQMQTWHSVTELFTITLRLWRLWDLKCKRVWMHEILTQSAIEIPVIVMMWTIAIHSEKSCRVMRLIIFTWSCQFLSLKAFLKPNLWGSYRCTKLDWYKHWDTPLRVTVSLIASEHKVMWQMLLHQNETQLNSKNVIIR